MTKKPNISGDSFGDFFSSKEAGHAVNIVKAILATVPFTGGIASLMSDYIPDKRRERLERLAVRVSNDFEEFEDRIDEEWLRSEDFAFEFERCFKRALDENRAEKIDAYRGIILNAALNKSNFNDQTDYFVTLVDRLSSLHIKLLSFMSAPQEYLAVRGISESRILGGFSSFFPVAMEIDDVLAIQSAFGDLHQMGFTNTDKNMFNTMTAGEGLNLLGDRLTPFGHSFVNFFKMPKSDG